MSDLLEKTYLIAGVTYRMEPLSWQQCAWLGEHIFNGVDIHALDYATVHDILRQKGPLFMAICLIADSDTRAQHSQRPFTDIQARAQLFGGELSGEEVGLFGPHFFRSNHPAHLAMLVSGKTLQAQLHALSTELSAAPGPNGSNAASSPSPTESATAPAALGATGDRQTPNATWSGASNGAR